MSDDSVLRQLLCNSYISLGKSVRNEGSLLHVPFGGCWKRLLEVVKSVLRKSVDRRSLSWVELETSL